MNKKDKSAIKVRGVSKIYQMGDTKVKALDDVSLEIENGEFIALVGPSGSGKSTLLHVLGGLDRPSSGEIIWEGKNLGKISDKELAAFRNQKIGFVFQQFHLLAKTSVLENTLLPTMYNCQNDRECHQRALQILDDLGLSSRLDHTPAQLSGGQQQRVAIARALINSPQVIFADEPTGNLDSKSGQQIMKILKDLNTKKGITLIIVTHDLELAQQAKRVIQMKDGKIVKDSKNK